MKKLITFSLIITLVLVVSGCTKDSNLKPISYQEFKEKVTNQETFILEVMSSNCSACVSFKPKLRKVANEYDIIVRTIDIDRLSKEEVETLKITGTPTVLFFINGIEESTSMRINGNVTEDRIISKFKANGFLEDE